MFGTEFPVALTDLPLNSNGDKSPVVTTPTEVDLGLISKISEFGTPFTFGISL